MRTGVGRERVEYTDKAQVDQSGRWITSSSGTASAGLKKPRRGYWITDSQITGRSAARCSTRCRHPFSFFPAREWCISGPCWPRLSQYGPTYYAYQPSWLLSKWRKYRRIPLEKPTANVAHAPANTVGPTWLGENHLFRRPRRTKSSPVEPTPADDVIAVSV